jgi:hypothetical protein
LSLARNLIASRGGVVAEHFQFFDVGQSRWLPWSPRPEASRLLAALRDPSAGRCCSDW